MNNPLLRLISLLAFAGPLLAAQAQVGFNISFHEDIQSPVPSSSYSAASAQSGVWNGIALSSPSPFPMVDTGGNPTQVSIAYSGFYTPVLFLETLPANASDDDRRLLETVHSVYSNARYTLSGLVPGDYSLYVYTLGNPGGEVTAFTHYHRLIYYSNPVFQNGFVERETHAILNFTVQAGEDIDVRVFVGFSAAWDSTNLAGFQIVPGSTLHAHKFCDSTANSTGSMADMVVVGSSSLQANDLKLGVRRLPTNQIGYFIVSTSSGPGIIPPGTQGNLCIGGQLGRHNRWGLGEVQFSGPTGAVLMDVDLTDVPTPTGPVSIRSGQTWRWQYWYRDHNPHNTSNFSDAYQVMFMD